MIMAFFQFVYMVDYIDRISYIENSSPRKLTTSTKTQTIDYLTVANPKEGKTHTIIPPTMKTKITGTSNHWSLISLNINGLNSSIKRHRLTDWI